MMKLVFIKGRDKMDWMDVYREGRSVERVDCPKQRIIPHDMVHFAVESTLRRRGFIRRVADGESASYGMATEPHSDAVERLVEVFQGDAWSGGTTPNNEMIDLYRVTCDARACPMLAITPQDVDAVHEAMQQLTKQWADVPPLGALTLRFDALTDAGRNLTGIPDA
jgi:hypothetical protein